MARINGTGASALSNPVTVSQGGTGQTTYTNGQLLIGNTTGNTLTKATITGTANQVVVTNGTGTITLSTPQSIATSSSPTFAGLTINGLITATNADANSLLLLSGGAGNYASMGIGRTAMETRIVIAHSGGAFSTQAVAGDLVIRNEGSSSKVLIQAGTGAGILTVTNANVVIGAGAALATNATDGFLYIPTSAGAPTGVPTAYTGKVAMEFDTTNNKLMIYDGGWIGVTLA